MSDHRKLLPCLDLFSGIGMFTYSFKDLFRTVTYCEKDLTCQQVLLHNMRRGRLPKAPISSDIRHLRGSELRKLRPKAITAGFPCQDISLANPYGLGLRGKRSGLIYDVFRLIDELPTIQLVFLENSPVILKRGLEVLLKELQTRDFDISYGVFSAEDCGAPQIRRRAFILAVRGKCSLPTASKRILMSRWSHEPCPRVIPRNTADSYRYAIKRNCLAGNSVVPQAVMWAYTNLRLAVMKGLNRATSRSNVPLHTIKVHFVSGEVQCFKKPAALRPKPVMCSLMKQGSIEIRKSFWMTPAASPLWYQYRFLTDRSSFLLSNQIFYDVETVRYMKFVRHDTTESERHDKYFMISPDWVAWLMGHPMDWTRVSRQHMSGHLELDGCNSPEVLALTDGCSIDNCRVNTK